MFGHASPCFLPHNLYYELKAGTYSPSLHQLFALSKLSNYTMADWLHVFGFDLEEIPRLQFLLPAKRTVVLDSSLNDPKCWVPWLRNKSTGSVVPPVAPLSQVLEIGPSVRQSVLLGINNKQFLYAKIGREDALAFPDLLPGSIIRINPRLVGNVAPQKRECGRIFVIEHATGICACRLLSRGKNRVALVSTHLPYAQVELRLEREIRILGAVDLEIRSAIQVSQPEVPPELTRRWKPEPLAYGVPLLSHFLRAARMKAALSLREASSLSWQVATLVGDNRYFLSASALSDYEARDTVPRHFQKVISLCLVYAIPFRNFLEVAGVPARKAGSDSIPDRLISRVEPARIQMDGVAMVYRDKGVLGEMIRRCEDVPFFLKNAIGELSGLSSPSLRSFFWVGGIAIPIHQYLKSALLVSVDLHRKRPDDSRLRPLWDQALYVVLKRDGGYVCGPCGVENGALVMHPDPDHLNLREEFRNHRDAEVVGQICAVMRKL